MPMAEAIYWLLVGFPHLASTVSITVLFTAKGISTAFPSRASCFICVRSCFTEALWEAAAEAARQGAAVKTASAAQSAAAARAFARRENFIGFGLLLPFFSVGDFSFYGVPAAGTAGSPAGLVFRS